MTIEQLFTGANLFVLPFWALMIFLPNTAIARKVMENYIPFVVLAVLYLFLLSTTITSESAQALSNPKLADIAHLLGEERAAATGWVHFLMMDLFVGRWIYWEGQRTGVWTVHSIAFCFLAGPLGLLSHLLTDWVSQKFFPRSPDEPAAPTPTSPAKG